MVAVISYNRKIDFIPKLRTGKLVMSLQEHGIDKSALAKSAGVSRSTIGRALSGENVSYQTALALEQALAALPALTLVRADD